MAQNLSRRQLQKQNQDIFSFVATKYDFMNKITSMGMEPFWKRRAVNCLTEISDTSLVMDLCGGTGDLTNLSLRRFKQGQYIVYDLNADMLNAGKAKIPENLRTHVTYMQGNAMQLPFADNSLDKVMVCFGLRNVPNMQDCLVEIARVLKPQGQMVCLEFAIPRIKLIRLLYQLYMFAFVRPVLKLITKNASAYNYLASSIIRFATPAEVLKAIETAGLTNRRQIKLFCGVGYIYDADK